MDNQQHQPNLLDVPISIFADAWKIQPEGVTTLRRIVSTRHYYPQIEAIRAEPDDAKQKELKKQLRAYAPVAQLHHRKEGTSFTDKISQQWPMLAVDVDRQDNPVVDMATLKRHLCRLPYVLLCAYSVRGGLWLVVRLPDNQTPETLAAHFRHLQKVFTDVFGVTIDSSKGSNPTSLRYVSYDAAPYFNENASMMSGMYTPPKPAPRQYQHHPSRVGRDSPLTWLIRYAQAAPEGQRHVALRNASRTAGGYIAAGQLDEQSAIDALEAVAIEWPTFSKSQKTIRQGVRYGQKDPIYVDVDHGRPQRPERPGQYRTTITAVRDYPARPNNTWLLNGKLRFGEVLNIDPSETYPDEWNTPDPTDAVPTIRELTTFEWQRQHPEFNRSKMAELTV